MISLNAADSLNHVLQLGITDAIFKPSMGHYMRCKTTAAKTGLIGTGHGHCNAKCKFQGNFRHYLWHYQSINQSVSLSIYLFIHVIDVIIKTIHNNADHCIT